MRVKDLRWLFLAVLVVLVVVSTIGEPATIGISTEVSEGQYRFSAGTDPAFLALALVILALYLLLMFMPATILGKPLPGLWPRFCAFWLDFIFAMTAIGALVGMVPAVIEWRRTGIFEWHFERTVPMASDQWMSALGFLAGILGLVVFFAFPLIRSRPTPGGCVAGYLVIADGGTTITPRTAVLRTLLGFVALCGAYVAPFIGRDRKKGKFWLDKVFGTRAMTLR
jgi:hypothetical protein